MSHDRIAYYKKSTALTPLFSLDTPVTMPLMSIPAVALLKPCAFGARRPHPRSELVARGAQLPARDRTVCQQALQRASILESLQRGAWQTGLSFLAALLLACEPAHAGDTLLGPARVVDGDTLEVRQSLPNAQHGA